MKIIHKIRMDLDRCSVPGFDTVQGDRNTRQLEIQLFSGGESWPVPEDAGVIVRYQRPDGCGGCYDRMPDDSCAWSISGNAVTVMLASGMMALPGCVILTVTLSADDREISTFQILMNVHPAAGTEVAEEEDHWYFAGSLPQTRDARVGELLEVTALDAAGRVAGLRTVPRDLTDDQYWALEALLKLARYREDPKAALAAFREAFGRYVPATGIALDAMGIGIASGVPQQLTATLTPENSTDEVEWATSDPEVATVENGLVTPVGNGRCTVTATAGSVSARCTVTVTGMSHSHNYAAVVYEAPSCTEIGGQAYLCSCGDGYIEKIPATGHSYVHGICSVCGARDPEYFPDGYYAVEWVQQDGCYISGVLTQGEGCYNTGLIAIGTASKLYCKWVVPNTYYITYFDTNGKYLVQNTGAWSDMKKNVSPPSKAVYVAVSYSQGDIGDLRVMFNTEDVRYTVDNALAAGTNPVTNVIQNKPYTATGMTAVTSVTMNGVDITGEVYDSEQGIVEIPAVTGNVVIR